MADTLIDWEIPITLVKITQEISEGDLLPTKEEINFKGVLQPLRAEQLNLKPEGQRSWEWIWIHARTSELNLETADKVIFNNKQYKVESKKDYGLNGFIEYELVRDYEETELISDKDN